MKKLLIMILVCTFFLTACEGTNKKELTPKDIDNYAVDERRFIIR